MVTSLRDPSYLKASLIGVGTALLMIVANGAVGIVGNEENPVNRLFSGVVLIGAAGALLVRFRPRGMAWVMYAMVAALVGVSAYLAVTGQGLVPGVVAVFGAAWVIAGRLFSRVAVKP